MLKRIFILIFGVISLMSFRAKSGDADEILAALKSGTSSEVAQYFDNFIDLTLPEKEEIKNMGKNQAGLALKGFYEEIDVKTYLPISQRESASTMYMAGKLQAKNGNKNITIMLKNTAGKYSIISIRIS